MKIRSLFQYVSHRLRYQVAYPKSLNYLPCTNDKQSSTPPLISLIIPTRDRGDLLKIAIDSILESTKDFKLEILICNNQSQDEPTLEYLDQLVHSGAKVLDCDFDFNYSKLINLAAREATGDVLLIANNDIAIINLDSILKMYTHLISSPDSTLIGSRLVYRDGSTQHAGIAMGLGGLAGNVKSSVSDSEIQTHCHEVSGVTFAMAMVRRSDFNRLGGLDEEFPVGLNDVDFAVRVMKGGGKSIVCNGSKVLHHESASRPAMNSIRGFITAAKDINRFLNKYPDFYKSQDQYFKLTR